MSVFAMSGTISFGFASTVCERWSSGILGLVDSELVVAEIICQGDLVPSSVQGFPDFWKRWTLKIHRGGTVTTFLPEESAAASS